MIQFHRDLHKEISTKMNFLLKFQPSALECKNNANAKCLGRKQLLGKTYQSHVKLAHFLVISSTGLVQFL